MPYPYKGAKRGYSKAAAESVKRPIREQPKSTPAIALKQTYKAALKATLKTRPIEAASLA